MTITFSTAAQPAPPKSAPSAAGAAAGAEPGMALPGATVQPLFAQFLGLAGLAGTNAEAAAADSDAADTLDCADSDQDADAAGSQGDSALPAMAMPLPNMAAMPMAPVAMNNTAWPSGAAGLERGPGEVANAAAPVAAAAIALRSPADRTLGGDAAAARVQTAFQSGADSAASGTLALHAQAPSAAEESPAPSGAERGIGTPGLWGVNGAPATAAPAADTIRLAGPAPQWQQALKDALGERLSVQLERNMEHAVIRIDPPMLGRIEISVRHAAGALQVNLSASNGEVLQQLRSIGESMRNDLAQRQYTEVSVNISATPRAAATPSFADGGDGARGRHPGRDQQEDGPGRALSEAGQAFSTFALSGQE